MKDLASVSKTEQKQFLDSFDTILTDIDGVVWFVYQKIPGSLDCIETLRKLDKKIHYVTNNSTNTFNDVFQRLKNDGFIENENDLCIPSRAIIAYLKSIKFNKELYILAVEAFKNEFKDAGFTINEETENFTIQNLTDLKKCFMDNENIGAVITDIDFNFNYAKLQKAVTYLKRSDVLFISGALDKQAPFFNDHWIIGPYYMYRAIEWCSGRKTMHFAKPATYLNDHIVKQFDIKDKSRVLMIGDTINEDMGFGANNGYKKLLVLSGNTKMDSLKNWQSNEEFKPDYYVENLGILNKIIKSL